MAVAASSVELWCRESDPVDIVVAGARVVDPLEQIDATLDVTIEDGVIAALEPARAAALAPSVDPGFRRPARTSAHARPRG